jgi:flagellar basal body-associated protein FliL
MTVIVALASLGVGAAGGMFAIGPMMVGGGSAGAESGDGGRDQGGGGGHGGGGGEATIWEIDNLVVNPRDTQGTRFLVVGLAIRMADGSTPQQMLSSDPDVRDAVLGLLSAMTVEELSDPATRESLKVRIKDAMEVVIGKGRIGTVLIPQFVLQ